MVLESTLSTFDNNKFPQVALVVQQSIELWKRGDIRSVDWKTAARVTARAAAWAAGPVAEAAADQYDYFADELIKLLLDAQTT
jgi:hypothetical protein